MNDEIVRVEEVVNLGALSVRPENVIAQASAVATSLSKVIEDKKLYSVITGKKYVTVDGWTSLGAMLGVMPREVETKRLEDGGYESKIELIRVTDQAVIGGASSVVGMDESSWAKRPEYARRSMAQTRATGKAFRLGFSWIIKLAGYEATPAEEMDFIDAEVKPAKSEPVPFPRNVNDAADIVGSDGVRYGDCTDEDLRKKLIGINKGLMKDPKDANLGAKKAACEMILNSRGAK